MTLKYFKILLLAPLVFIQLPCPNSEPLIKEMVPKLKHAQVLDHKDKNLPQILLMANQPQMVHLEPNTVARFQLNLQPQDYFEIHVEQGGLDVVVTLQDSLSNVSLTSDLPTGGSGTERIIAVTPELSKFHLLIRAYDKTASGTVTLELRNVTSASQSQREGAKAFQELAAAISQSNSQGLQAIEQAKDALNHLPFPFISFYAQVELARKWLELGKPFNALNEFKHALKTIPFNNTCPWRSFLFSQMAHIYDQIGQPTKAKEHFLAAIQSTHLCGNTERTADALVQLGQFHYSRREITDALQYLKQALAQFQQQGLNAGIIDTMEKIAKCNSYLGQPKQARDFLQQALDLSQKQSSQPLRGRLLVQFGWTYFIENRYEQALQYYDNALKIFENKKLIYSQAFALDRKGTTLRAMKKYQLALEAYEKAIAIYERKQNAQNVAIIQSNISQIYAELNDWQNTIYYGQKALQGYQTINKPRLQPKILSVLAHAKSQTGHLVDAKELLEKALSILEEQRAESQTRKQGQSFTTTRHDFYQQYLELLSDLHLAYPLQGYSELALKWSEKNKARSLLERTIQSRLLKKPETIEKELERIAKELSDLEQKRLQLELTKNSQKAIDIISRNIRTKLAIFDELTYQKPKSKTDHITISLDTIQNFIPNKQTSILAFSFGKSRLFLWEITKGSYYYHVLNNKEIFLQKLQRQHMLLQKGWKRTSRQERRVLNQELSNLLFGKIVHFEPNRTFIIIPDGILHYLPFAMLLKPSKKNHQQPRSPIISEHNIIYGPSISFLISLTENRPKPSSIEPSIAIFADPVLSSDDPRLKKTLPTQEIPNLHSSSLRHSLRSMNRSGLSRLNFTQKEAEVIHALVSDTSSMVARGFDATRQAFFAKNLTNYSYLHIATHGLLHPNTPDLGGLVLSQYDQKGNPTNGFIRTFEILGKRWPTELVTLSACSTGVGQLLEGEGPVGLAQAFLEGGTARVMASLWNVSDNSTAVLMEKVYTNIFKKKMTPSKALQAAQIDMLSKPEWEDPFFWAGFIVIGEIGS